MNWLLPPMTEEAFRAHLAVCDALLKRNAPWDDDDPRKGNQFLMRFIFTRQHAQPSVRPQAGDHLFIRVNRDVIGYYHVVGTNRAFEKDLRTRKGWEVLYVPVLHELDPPLPAPSHSSWCIYTSGPP